MYSVLYEAWLREKKNTELQSLKNDFYKTLVEYISWILQEGRMLDKKSVKAKLVSREFLNVKWLLRGLFRLRFEKMIKSVIHQKSVVEVLTVEEERIIQQLESSFKIFQSLMKDALRGRTLRIEGRSQPQKRVVLRFLQEIPAIVCEDLKVYGPFLPEDISALPISNAKVLVKQGLAVEIETE